MARPCGSTDAAGRDTAPARLVRVLVADPDPTAGPALCALVDRHPRLTLSSFHLDGARACAAALEEQPDVAVLAAGLPALDGRGVRQGLASAVPHMRFVLVEDGGSMAQSDRTVVVPRSLDLPSLVRVVESFGVTRTAAGDPVAGTAPEPRATGPVLTRPGGRAAP